MLDARVRKLGQMDHAICAAKIDKRAEFFDAADDAFELLAGLDRATAACP